MPDDLNELIHTYGEKMLRYATSVLCNHHDAEDTVQDVFLFIYHNPDRFKGGNFNAWIYKLTYNRCIDKLRRRKFLFVEDVKKEVDSLISPEQVAISEDVLSALSQLKPMDRALVYGKVVEGYSYAELSEQMGKTQQSLRKRYERAKQKLHGYLIDKTTNTMTVF